MRISEIYKQPKAPAGQLKGKEKMPKAKGGRKDHPHGGRLVGEAQIDEIAPIVAVAVQAALWLIRWATTKIGWRILKYVVKRHAGKLAVGATAAYYIDQGWDWVVETIGEEAAQMLIDNKFTIAMAVTLILGAVALKRFFEKKGDAMVAKYQESISEMTSAGAVGAVAMPIGQIQRRTQKKKKKKA